MSEPAKKMKLEDILDSNKGEDDGDSGMVDVMEDECSNKVVPMSESSSSDSEDDTNASVRNRGRGHEHIPLDWKVSSYSIPGFEVKVFSMEFAPAKKNKSRSKKKR